MQGCKEKGSIRLHNFRAAPENHISHFGNDTLQLFFCINNALRLRSFPFSCFSLFRPMHDEKSSDVVPELQVYVNLFRHVMSINPITLIISTLSVTFLLTVKIWLEPLLQRWCHCNFPLPSELILVSLRQHV